MSSQAHEWQTIGHSLTEVRPASRCPSPNSNLFGSFLNGSFLNVSLFSPVFRLDEAIGKAVDLVREVLTEQNIEGQCLTEIEMSFL